MYLEMKEKENALKYLSCLKGPLPDLIFVQENLDACSCLNLKLQLSEKDTVRVMQTTITVFLTMLNEKKIFLLWKSCL